MEQQNFCCICFNTNVLCSTRKAVDSEIIQLLKFLIINVNVGALENVLIGMDCLKKILAACEYKYKNLKDKIIKSDCKESVCQKCEKELKEDEAYLLVDCVTEIDWSDFVNYLFENRDIEELGNSQICGSCRISVSDIQDILNLICIYDQSKIQCNVDYLDDDIKMIENENSTEIKETESNDLIKQQQIALIWINNDEKNNYVSFENFKLKNEETDMKLEYSNGDDTEKITLRYEKLDDGKEISSGNSYIDSAVKEELAVKYLEINGLEDMKNFNYLKCKVDTITNDIKSNMCGSGSSVDSNELNNHSKEMIENEEGFKCNDSNYETAKNNFSVKNNQIVKYQHYKYDTKNKFDLIKYLKAPKEIKCTHCSKSFTSKRNLANHLLTVHNTKDNIDSKLHNCDQCDYETTGKQQLLVHMLRHGNKDGFEIFKCQQCTFETYHKNSLMRHKNIHNTIKDYKCIFCSKSFTQKDTLNNHLLRIHKCTGVAKKLYNCDQCSYGSLRKSDLQHHKLKHGVKDGIEILKCNQCTYETYYKSNLIKHTKSHKNVKDYKCTYCSKEFKIKKSLGFHLKKIHQC